MHNVFWVQKQTEKRKRRIEKLRNTEIFLPESLTSKTLAATLGIRTIDVLKVLIKLNECPKSSEEVLDKDLADMVVMDFGRIPFREVRNTFNIVPRLVPEDNKKYPLRTPIVTVMGHVNHGKTTLLDTIRTANVASQEAGGITQRMAAFLVKVSESNEHITFIDTPGHEAFAIMRQRGANVTDIAILVVAADEGVKEQTIQAIKYIEESGCRIIVAITKCDKINADPEKVRLQLNSHNIHLAKYGGEIFDVEVSAFENRGIKDLQDLILMVAGGMDLHADPTGLAESDILDVNKDYFHGTFASCILRLGSLKKGLPMIAGLAYGKAKQIFDESGNIVDPEKIKPGMPFSLNGWEITPVPGEQILFAQKYELVKLAFQQRKIISLSKSIYDSQKIEAMEKEITQKDRMQAVELGLDQKKFVRKQKELRDSLKAKEIPLFLKADSIGSIEAIVDGLKKLPSDEVKLRILRPSIGVISVQDVIEAGLITPKGIVVGFNSSLGSEVLDAAIKNEVDVKNFQIYYHLIDWIKEVLSKHLKPQEIIKVLSEAKVLEIFRFIMRGKNTLVAGCLVTSGIFRKKTSQIIRDGSMVHECTIRSLKHVKEEAKEITSGKECGIIIGGDNFEPQVDDIIQNIERTYQSRKLGE